MLRLLADEDAHGHVISGLRRRNCPDLDMLRVQDTELMGRHDREVLEWATRQDRVVLTDDAATMIDSANDRVRRGEPMVGLFVLRNHGSRGDVIDDILLIARACDHHEWANQVVYIPLRT